MSRDRQVERRSHLLEYVHRLVEDLVDSGSVKLSEPVASIAKKLASEVGSQLWADLAIAMQEYARDKGGKVADAVGMFLSAVAPEKEIAELVGAGFRAVKSLLGKPKLERASDRANGSAKSGFDAFGKAR